MSLQADPTGQFLFVTTPTGGIGNVATLFINALTGAVTVGPSAAPPKGAGQVLVKSDGRCVYTTDLATLSHYPVDPLTGTLTNEPHQIAAPSPISSAMDPLGHAFYVALGLTAPQAQLFAVHLFAAEVTSCDFFDPPSATNLAAPPGAMVVDPGGAFLYVALPNTGGGGALAGFRTQTAFPPATISIGNVATGQAFNGPMVITYSLQ